MSAQQQKQGEQSQKQELPPDPVREQQQSYKTPENAIQNDPITEVTTEEPAKEEPKKEPEHGSGN